MYPSVLKKLLCFLLTLLALPLAVQLTVSILTVSVLTMSDNACLSLLCTVYVSECIKEIAVLLADDIDTSTCCPADNINADGVNADSVSADNVRYGNSECLQ